jgi:single-strand DNA-binding protein
MNKVILIGRCGGDPEIKTFDWGKVAKMSFATSEKFTNRNKEKVEKTTWHNLIFHSNIDVLGQYVHKGDQLMVEGKISVRNYTDKSGQEQWAYEVMVDRFEFLNKKLEEKKSGKVDVKSMSDPDDLPIHIKEQQEVSSMDDVPY